MPPQTPLLLVDNVFDTIALYPDAVLDTSAELAGHEAFRVASARRDRQWWTPGDDGDGSDHWIRTHLAAALAIEAVVIDRGSNLNGRSVFLEGGTDGAAWPVSIELEVPDDGDVGGTPLAPAMALTEEGVAWTLLGTATAAKLYWRLRVPDEADFIPVITGLMAGAKHQLLGYSNVFDEDAGGRTETSETSRAGYRATDRTYSWRTCELGLSLIGATEYDATIRRLRTLLFERNQPYFCWLDYGTRPERGWMFQYDGAAWGMAKNRVHRSGRIRSREVGPRVGA